MGVLAGDGEGVDAGELAGGTFGVVAGGGDLGVAHAVADEEDDVLGAGVAHGVPDVVGLVAIEAAGTTVGGDVSFGGAVGEGAGFGGRRSGSAVGAVVIPTAAGGGDEEGGGAEGGENCS